MEQSCRNGMLGFLKGAIEIIIKLLLLLSKRHVDGLAEVTIEVNSK